MLIGIYATAFIFSILSTLAGIGGGAIFIPLFMLLGNQSIKEAIFLSLITMVGNTLSRVIYYSIKRHHACSQRYLTNYEIVKVFLPFNANSTYLGFLLNQLLPDIVILILIILLMIMIISKTILSLVKFRKELQHPEDDTNEYYASLDMSRGETWRDSFDYLLYAILVIGLIIMFSFMRNQSSYPWMIYLSQFFLLTLFGYYSIQQIRLQDRWRSRNNFIILEGDLDWTEWKNYFKITIVSSITGICSALLGIGSGLIMNPFMLHLEVHPSVMLATSAWTTFFSVTISTIQHLGNNFHLLNLIHLAVFLIGFSASIIGLVILRYIENQRSAKFVISLILVMTMILCSILLIIINLIQT